MTTHWILTATGRDFPLSGLPTVMPDAAPRIEDIAHALAQINRYTGHAARPYSVAEHSMLVCDIVRAKGLNAHAQLLALLHDAHEAYCGDVASPIKTVLGAAWLQFENALAHRVRNLLAPGQPVQIASSAPMAQGLHQRYVPSIAKARAELGLELRHTLDDAVREVARHVGGVR